MRRPGPLEERLENVTSGNDPHQFLSVEDWQTTDLTLEHYSRRVFHGSLRRNRKRVGGHDRPDRGVCFQSLVEANVPIGDDTDEYVILDYGQATKAADSHTPLGIGYRVLGSYGYWVWRHFGADQHESLLGLLPDSSGK
jgi:hypothetical protein